MKEMTKMRKEPLGRLTVDLRHSGKKGDIVYIWSWIGSHFIISSLSNIWDQISVPDHLVESHRIDYKNQKFKDGTFRQTLRKDVD